MSLTQNVKKRVTVRSLSYQGLNYEIKLKMQKRRQSQRYIQRLL